MTIKTCQECLDTAKSKASYTASYELPLVTLYLITTQNGQMVELVWGAYWRNEAAIGGSNSVRLSNLQNSANRCQWSCTWSCLKMSMSSRSLTSPEWQYSTIQRMCCNSVCPQTVSTLTRQTLQNSHRPCSSSMAVSTKHGGNALSTGASTARVRFWYWLLERKTECECWCIVSQI